MGLGIAGALIGGSLISGVLGSSASKSAANTQAAAADRSAEFQLQAQRETNELQKYIYDQNVARQQPWVDAGRRALSSQERMAGDVPTFSPGEFTESDAFRFNLAEGLEAIDQGAAARGIRLSGSALEDRARFAQGLASNERGRWYGEEWDKYQSALNASNTRFNRYGVIAGSGQVANQNLQSAGQNYASGVGAINASTAAGVGNAYQTAGNAIAQGRLNSASSWQSVLGDAAGIVGMGYGGAFGASPGLGIQPNPAGLQTWGWV